MKNKYALSLAVIFLLIADKGISRQNGGIKADQIFSIDRGHSYVGFSIQYMGYAKVRGRFEDFTGTVIFDEDDWSKTSASIRIMTASIDTDNNWRDNDLKSENWFEVEKFPEITFHTSKVEKNENGLSITGDLTIKGITKEITLDFAPPMGVHKDVRGDSQVIFNGTVTIDRTDFGVEGERWSKIKEGITAVDSEVDIELTILGKRYNAPNFKNFVRNPETPQGKVYSAYQEGGVKRALEEFENLRKQPDSKLNPSTLNLVGYMLLKEGKVSESIELLKANVNTFPDDGNVYDSIGEAWLASGDVEKARSNYRKSLDINPDNINAKEILRNL